MDGQFRQIRRRMGTFFLLWIGLFCGYATGAEEGSGQQWIVKSVYQDPITNKDLSDIFWTFTETTGSSGPLISVKDRVGKTGFRQELFFNADDALVRVASFRRIRNREIKQTESFDPHMPALLEDSIVPSDWINAPLPWDGEPVEFIVKKEVGRLASFATHIRMSGQVMTPQQAEEEEMISSGLMSQVDLGTLLLVKIEKIDQEGKAREILKQLWPSNMSFWLYEATSTRESWYVFE